MAPLGVLTAVVSVIRVCGTPTLRAFIGRAQEGSGIAEAELCSSTSRDVCEMYKNGAITRVFGRPKILEFVQDTDEANFYDSRGLGTASAGLYTFPEYLKTIHGREKWKEIQKSRSPASEEEPFAPYPNLMLNIGFKQSTPTELRLIALFSVMLQVSVIAYAVICDKYLKLTKEGQLPPSWGLPLMVVGTIFLCTGMGFSSYLIETSSTERNFQRLRKGGSIVHWVQPGGQVVGDHTFDSWAYNDSYDPIRRFVSSRRKVNKQKESALTWAAASGTVIGFILQFVGLRTVHSSVSVYQLSAVLLMSAGRAMLRRRRSD
ncbi:hypothetical protein CC80DRAFT_578465, partial [Byssothecium circinans]